MITETDRIWIIKSPMGGLRIVDCEETALALRHLLKAPEIHEFVSAHEHALALRENGYLRAIVDALDINLADAKVSSQSIAETPRDPRFVDRIEAIAIWPVLKRYAALLLESNTCPGVDAVAASLRAEDARIEHIRWMLENPMLQLHPEIGSFYTVLDVYDQLVHSDTEVPQPALWMLKSAGQAITIMNQHFDLGAHLVMSVARRYAALSDSPTTK